MNPGKKTSFATQYQKYMCKLNPSDALTGSAMKSPLYQSQRLLQNMDPAKQEYIEMESLRQLVQACEQLHEGLFSLPEKQRVELLEHVCSLVDPLPLPFQLKLVILTARDAKLFSSEGVKHWLATVLPRPPVAAGTS